MARIDILGFFQLSRPLRPLEKTYLDSFVSIPHMKLDVAKLHQMAKGACGNPLHRRKSRKDVYGVEGEYFVGDVRDYPGGEEALLDSSVPPSTQPSRWCHWNLEGTKITWNGEEEFEKPIEWLQYLIKHFLDPWGIAVDGAVQWYGDFFNKGTISVWNSHIYIYHNNVDLTQELDSESESESGSES